MRRNKMSMRRVVGLMAATWMELCALGSGVPGNLDFERGDLSGWTGDGHWCVVTPDAAFAAPRVSVHGMFSAVAKSERGEAVVQSYEKSATYQGPRVLVSPPLEVSDRYLVLSLAGAPMKGGKGVSAELLDADGRPCAAPFVRGPAFAAFDVSALRGRTVRLRVTAVEAAAAVDNVFFAPLPIPRLVAVSRDGETVVTAEGELTATVRVRVLDHFNGVVLDAARPLVRGANAFAWKSVRGRRNRVFVTVALPDGRIVFDELQKVSPEAVAERQSVRLPHTGWTRCDTDDVRAERPPADAKPVPAFASPFKPSGEFFWRNAAAWKPTRAQQFYRLRLDVPRAAGPVRTLLRLPHGGGGLFALFVNGRQAVAETMLQSYADTSFDLTGFLSDGANDLLVRIRNPKFFVPGFPNAQPAVPVFRHADAALCGILGDGWIERVPSVAVRNCYIDARPDEDRVTCRTRLVNRGASADDVSVSARVFDDATGRLCGVLPPVRASVPAGGVALVTNAAVVADLPRWTPDTPRLLRLEISVSGKDGTDVVNERFGFRAYARDGRRFLLNGIPVTVLEALMQPDSLRAQWKTWWGANAIRRPCCLDQLDAADEEGYLTRMVQEDIYPAGSVNNPPEPPASFDAPFRKLEMAQFETFYNHPSVYLFCLGNELDGHGYFRAQTAARYGRLFGSIAAAIKAIDPDRPVCGSGDAIADFFRDRAWNVHYPHEYSIAHDLPRSGMLLSEGHPLHVLDPNRPWDGKPVFCGENFSESGVGPYLAAFGGDLSDDMANWFRVWRAFFRVRSRAMRMDGISAIAPFTPINTLRNYYPVELFLTDYRTQFDVGETVRLPVTVLHDVFVDEALDLRWTLRRGDETLSEGTLPVTLKAGERRSFRLPPIRLPQEEAKLALRLQLFREGRPLGRWGVWAGRLFAVKAEKPSTGPHFRRIRQTDLPTDPRALRDWVAAGNTLFVDVASPGTLQVGAVPVSAVDHNDSRTFNVARHDPLLRGLPDGLLRNWDRTTQRVMGVALLRPESAACRTLCVSGDESGMRFASCLEERHGNGRILYSTLGSVPGLAEADVPAWRRLVANASARAAADMGEAARRAPKALYADARDASVDVAALVRAAKGGATVVVARLTPQNLARFRPLVGDLSLVRAPDGNANALVAKTADSPLLDAITSEDLSWRRGRVMFVLGGKDMRTTLTAMYDWAVSGDGGTPGARALTRPGALWERPFGVGRVIVDQIRWPEAAVESVEALRTALTWYANLGLVDPTALSGRAQVRHVDLPFAGTWRGASNDLQLPSAETWFRTHPPAAILGSAAEFRRNPHTLDIPVPAVAARADRIVLDQANAFGYIDYSMGRPYATVTFGYADGTAEAQTLRYGAHGDDVRVKSAAPLGSARQVAEAKRDGVSVYRVALRNPRRDVDLKTVTVATADEKIVPIVFSAAAVLPAAAEGPRAALENGLWKLAARLRVAADDGRRVWSVCGPYANEWTDDPEKRPPAFDEPFAPERGIDLRRPADDRSWKRYADAFDASKPDVLHAMNPENILPFGTHRKDRYVSYFYTKVHSPVRQRALAAIGSDDGFKLWLNGRPVHEHFVLRGCRLGGDVCEVTLEKGWNTVLIKHIKMRLGAGIAFDLKPYDPKWREVSGFAIGERPSLPLRYDAYAADRLEIPGVLTIRAGGTSKAEPGIHSGSAVTAFTAPDGSQGLKLDYACAGGGGIRTKRSDFQRAEPLASGLFSMDLFFFRDEPLERKVQLAVRNAGGRHAGDVFVELAPIADGAFVLTLRYEGASKERDRVLTARVPPPPKERWLPLSVGWGRAGLRVALGDAVLIDQPDNHDRLFSTPVFTQLLVGPHMTRGALAFRNATLAANDTRPLAE